MKPMTLAAGVLLLAFGLACSGGSTSAPPPPKPTTTTTPPPTPPGTTTTATTTTGTTTAAAETCCCTYTADGDTFHLSKAKTECTDTLKGTCESDTKTCDDFKDDECCCIDESKDPDEEKDIKCGDTCTAELALGDCDDEPVRTDHGDQRERPRATTGGSGSRPRSGGSSGGGQKERPR